MRAYVLVLLLFVFTQGAAAQTVKPFGMEEIPTLGGIQEKWGAVIEASRNDKNSSELLAFKDSFESLSGRALVAHINRAVNQTVGIQSDIDQWGEEDHWSPALETLASKRGDCEDFAILKYAILKFFLPETSLRIVVGYDTQRHSMHAVVLVFVDEQWLSLNIRTNTLVPDVELTQFRPLLSLSASGAAMLILPRLSAK